MDGFDQERQHYRRSCCQVEWRRRYESNETFLFYNPLILSRKGPQQSGDADPYCDWTFTGCTRPDDVTTCPKGQWGITYDDGPTQYSSKLYDFLDQKQQKATLFMIGGQVVQFPDLVKRAYNTGHELAMHTW